MARDGVVRFIDEYAKRIVAPVRGGVNVTRLRPVTGSARFAVETEGGIIEASNVVVATGPYQEPSLPLFSDGLSQDLYQTTANRYSNPDRLPDGAVLVVGSGASGYQIAADLLKSGRQVHLSVGRHRRVPRRYRGKDYGYWQEATGALDQTADTLPPNFVPPLLTGVDGGRDADLRILEGEGTTLLGSLRGIHGNRLHFKPDLEENIAEGDKGVALFKRMVDAFVTDQDIGAPVDQQIPTATQPVAMSALELDVRAVGIGTIIWATGYCYDFRWIDFPVLDNSGKPRHRRGVTEIPGIYFLGLARLHKLKSAFLWGSGEDASYIAEHIAARK